MTKHATIGELWAVGVIRSELVALVDAPKQGREGAPDPWRDSADWATEPRRGLAVGAEPLVISWPPPPARDVFRAPPLSNPANPLTGVFATRSPDRPNPVGLHPVTVRAIDGSR